VGWQSGCSFSFRRERRTKSPQEVVYRKELTGAGERDQSKKENSASR
jgi:hypothetical protein